MSAPENATRVSGEVEAIVGIVLESYPTAIEIFFGTTDDYDDGRYFVDFPTLHLADDTYVDYTAPVHADGRNDNGTSCWTAELSEEYGPRLGKWDSMLIKVGPPIQVFTEYNDGHAVWERFGYRP